VLIILPLNEDNKVETSQVAAQLKMFKEIPFITSVPSQEDGKVRLYKTYSMHSASSLDFMHLVSTAFLVASVSQSF
jgi:hypothetical protein